MHNSVYLDCNATTPVDPRVRDVMLKFFEEEFGNSGSRTHAYGQQAAKAVARAREQICSAIGVTPTAAIFTSGATEANNLALLGLSKYGLATGKTHILSTNVEHKAVLEPLLAMRDMGFNVELLPVGTKGYVTAEEVTGRVTSKTLLVSIMHANNETGILNPIGEIAYALKGTDVFLHVDAAQTFGKMNAELNDPQIDAISLSAHKFHGPKGAGALILGRSRKIARAISPIMLGGGQERGLRPGTLPVPLIVGMGEAVSLISERGENWFRQCDEFKNRLRNFLAAFEPRFVGIQNRSMPNSMALSLREIDSDYVCMALQGVVAISNGSACTSDQVEVSHVLKAMDVANPESITRWSWSDLTPDPDWHALRAKMTELVS